MMYLQRKKSKRKCEGTNVVELAVTSKRQKQSVIEDTAEESRDHRPEGWISSLFVNNPDIPVFAHRVVKPVSEPVFSSQNFRDLPIHPFMVGDALHYLLHVVVVTFLIWMDRWVCFCILKNMPACLPACLTHSMEQSPS
jgi:hypothetical protein